MYGYQEALEASTDYFNGDELAAKVFVDKYALRDNDKNLLEKTPDDMHLRIASEIARAERAKYKDTNIKPLTKEQVYQYLKVYLPFFLFHLLFHIHVSNLQESFPNVAQNNFVYITLLSLLGNCNHHNCNFCTLWCNDIHDRSKYILSSAFSLTTISIRYAFAINALIVAVNKHLWFVATTTKTSRSSFFRQIFLQHFYFHLQGNYNESSQS